MYAGCTRNAYHLYMFRYDAGAVRRPARGRVPQGAAGRRHSRLRRLRAARTRKPFLADTLTEPRLPADLRRARLRGVARAEPLPAERPALRGGGLAHADDAAGPARRHGPDRRGGAQDADARGAAGEGMSDRGSFAGWPRSLGAAAGPGRPRDERRAWSPASTTPASPTPTTPTTASAPPATGASTTSSAPSGTTWPAQMFVLDPAVRTSAPRGRPGRGGRPEGPPRSSPRARATSTSWRRAASSTSPPTSASTRSSTAWRRWASPPPDSHVIRAATCSPTTWPRAGSTTSPRRPSRRAC